MRQEPIVYVNGSPYAPRAPKHPHANIITYLDADQTNYVCIHLASVLKKRVDKEDKTIKIHVDKEFAENPMDRIDLEESIVVDSIKDLDSVYDICKEKSNVDLQVVHIPVVEDHMQETQYYVDTACCLNPLRRNLKQQGGTSLQFCEK